MVQLRIFGETPANRTAVWHPPPTTRGTINILWSCVVTLLLCVWSAVHLNIPEYDPNKSKRSNWNPRGWVTRAVLSKIGWLIVGLLAPEMIAFMAWTQRREARELTKAVSELLSQAGESKSTKPNDTPPEDQGTNANHQSILDPPGQHIAALASRAFDNQIEMQPIESNPNPTMQPVPRHKWTHVHSFFCIQGGFVSGLVSPISKSSAPTGRKAQHTLTPYAIMLLAKHDPSWIPNVSLDELEDKSKSDGLAKSLVCVQASWFIVQCFFRLGSNGKYSISLLELNTLAHAICMLIIYWLWWDKPQDSREPIPITNVPADVLIARLEFLSRIDTRNGKRHKVVQPRSENLTTGLSLSMLTALINPDPFEGEAEELFDRRAGLRFTIGFTLAGAIYGGLHMLGWNAPFTSYTQLLLWRVSAITVTVSGPFLRILRGLLPILMKLVLMPNTNTIPKSLADSRGDRFVLRTLISFWAVISTVSLLLAVLLVATSFMLYLLARMYLLIECFISLAYLPESALKQPQWLASILHA